MERDAEHLKLLALVYYIRGGINALFSCIFIIYIVMGGIFLMVPQVSHNNNNAPPAVMGLIFMILGSALLVVGWSIAGLTIYAGHCLTRRRHRGFCMVVAAINCLFIPYGTLLGVFSFMVLQRPSVQQLFDQPGGAP
jgi:hypothetical protein